MKKQNNNKGITLIALVITIIVLLILAGVTISLLTGKNGILTQAQKAKELNEISDFEEQIKLAVLTSKINSDSKIDLNTLESEIKKISDVEIAQKSNDNELPWIVRKREKTCIIESDGTIKLDSVQEDITEEAGLYNTNNEMVVSWNELVEEYGLDLSKDYTPTTYETDEASLYNILKNNEFDEKKLVIGNNTNKIGTYAFIGCTKLLDVQIPDSVVELGNAAFQGTNVENVRLSNNLTSIGIGMFSGCNKLQSINIPDNITEIQNGAFSSARALKSVNMSKNINKIGDGAFQGAALSGDLKFYAPIEYVGNGAFSNTSISSAVFENNVKNFGAGVFSNCSLLTSIELRGGVDSLTPGAFGGSIALKSIYFGEGTTELSFNALAGCNNLKNVVLPKTITKISDSAFGGDKSLTEINIPESVTEIGNSAFGGCESLTSITIPSSVITTGTLLFTQDYKLETVILKGDISSGYNKKMFDGCPSIKNIKFEGNYSITDSIISSDLVNLETVYFASATQLQNGMFAAKYSKLQNIVLPNNLETISAGMFNACVALKTIQIPTSVKTIGMGAFAGCTDLEVTIPDGVETIESGAFGDVKHIYYNGPATDISNTNWGAKLMN